MRLNFCHILNATVAFFEEKTMDGKHLPWHLPLTDWCIGAMVLFATTGTVILCRFLLRKWRSWRIQRFLDQRSALASPGDQKLTTYDKQVLTKKVRQSGNERLEKSFAFQGNLDSLRCHWALRVSDGCFGRVSRRQWLP